MRIRLLGGLVIAMLAAMPNEGAGRPRLSDSSDVRISPNDLRAEPGTGATKPEDWSGRGCTCTA